VAAVLVLAAVVMVALVPLARGAHDRATARAAADAAALAGAAEGREAAREVAAANRAELVDYLELGDDVLVVVTVGQARAAARARREAWPDPPPVPGG
jgi:hypothetical protein